jgi:hypothetical protein
MDLRSSFGRVMRTEVEQSSIAFRMSQAACPRSVSSGGN